MSENTVEIIAEDKYGQKRVHVKVICKNCKREYLTRKSLFLKGKGIFCSRKCRHEFRTQKRVVIICSLCGKEKLVLPKTAEKKTKYGYRFCSLECKNKAQCFGGLIQPPSYKKKLVINPEEISTNCICCGKKLAKKQIAYCSHQCHFDLKNKRYLEKWKNGEKTGNRSNNEQLSLIVREYMLKKAKYKCQKCNWGEINPKSGKIPLTINHIDGDAGNSKEYNLEVICPNCHSLTPTFGSLNKGNGRITRRLRARKAYHK